MAGSIDKLAGLAILGLASTLFVYYTFWVIITPFIDQGHVVLSFFPDREWAIIVPLVLILLVLFALTTFISLVMIKTSQKSKLN